MSKLELKPVEFATGTAEGADGYSVWAGEMLVGLLKRFGGQSNGRSGHWAIEYLPSIKAKAPLFDTAEEALRWIEMLMNVI